MVRHDGTWLRAGEVVYADPPSQPTVMNVRYIPEEQLPKGTRIFKPEKNHKTWATASNHLEAGASRHPFAQSLCWEVCSTITAQNIRQIGREADTVAVYTNGASPAAKMLQWFQQHNEFEYVLLRDPDAAG